MIGGNRNWWIFLFGGWMDRWSRDNAFPLLYWIGTWRVFDWLQEFQGWLDTVLPWRLRRRIAAMKKENSELTRLLDLKTYEAMDLKRLLIESVKKMRMPIRSSRYPIGDAHGFELDGPQFKTFIIDFERYRMMVSLDMMAFPRYSKDLLAYMSRQTAIDMVGHMTDHVEKEVRKFYEKEFLGVEEPL